MLIKKLLGFVVCLVSIIVITGIVLVAVSACIALFCLVVSLALLPTVIGVLLGTMCHPLWFLLSILQIPWFIVFRAKN
jgi:hypothetical protein